LVNRWRVTTLIAIAFCDDPGLPTDDDGGAAEQLQAHIAT
jgi:hypothetical protein